MKNQTCRTKNPGYLVTTKDGKKGRTYHSDSLVNGKVQVHVIDEKFNSTGEKLLCDPATLTTNGFID